MIYGISRAGMHLWVVRKTCGVTELRYSGNGAQPVPAVKLSPIATYDATIAEAEGRSGVPPLLSGLFTGTT
jgi:hypothetical protein